MGGLGRRFWRFPLPHARGQPQRLLLPRGSCDCSGRNGGSVQRAASAPDSSTTLSKRDAQVTLTGAERGRATRPGGRLALTTGTDRPSPHSARPPHSGALGPTGRDPQAPRHSPERRSVEGESRKQEVRPVPAQLTPEGPQPGAGLCPPDPQGCGVRPAAVTTSGSRRVALPQPCLGRDSDSAALHTLSGQTRPDEAPSRPHLSDKRDVV